MLLLTYIQKLIKNVKSDQTDWTKPDLECVKFKREDLLDGLSGLI
jgi:hypothetical protein